MRHYFAWLGSKRAAKRGVAEPACLLDKAAHAKLPVPAGGVLLHRFFELALAEGAIKQEDEKITAVSPQILHQLLYGVARFPKLEESVAIRPLLGNQFGSTQQPIQMLNSKVLADSLYEGWQQQTEQRDLLIMTLPKTVMMGTAVSPPLSQTDQITTEVETFGMPCLVRWQRPDGSLPPYAQRLQMLLRGIRRTFGDVGWEIEWRDDGEICWLWQLKQA